MVSKQLWSLCFEKLVSGTEFRLFTQLKVINPFLTSVPIWEHSFKFHFL